MTRIIFCYIGLAARLKERGDSSLNIFFTRISSLYQLVNGMSQLLNSDPSLSSSSTSSSISSFQPQIFKNQNSTSKIILISLMNYMLSILLTHQNQRKSQYPLLYRSEGSESGPAKEVRVWVREAPVLLRHCEMVGKVCLKSLVNIPSEMFYDCVLSVFPVTQEVYMILSLSLSPPPITHTTFLVLCSLFRTNKQLNRMIDRPDGHMTMDDDAMESQCHT